MALLERADEEERAGPAALVGAQKVGEILTAPPSPVPPAETPFFARARPIARAAAPPRAPARADLAAEQRHAVVRDLVGPGTAAATRATSTRRRGFTSRVPSISTRPVAPSAAAICSTIASRAARSSRRPRRRTADRAAELRAVDSHWPSPPARARGLDAAAARARATTVCNGRRAAAATASTPACGCRRGVAPSRSRRNSVLRRLHRARRPRLAGRTVGRCAARHLVDAPSAPPASIGSAPPWRSPGASRPPSSAGWKNGRRAARGGRARRRAISAAASERGRAPSWPHMRGPARRAARQLAVLAARASRSARSATARTGGGAPPPRAPAAAAAGASPPPRMSATRPVRARAHRAVVEAGDLAERAAHARRRPHLLEARLGVRVRLAPRRGARAHSDEGSLVRGRLAGGSEDITTPRAAGCAGGRVRADFQPAESTLRGPNDGRGCLLHRGDACAPSCSSPGACLAGAPEERVGSLVAAGAARRRARTATRARTSATASRPRYASTTPRPPRAPPAAAVGVGVYLTSTPARALRQQRGGRRAAALDRPLPARRRDVGRAFAATLCCVLADERGPRARRRGRLRARRRRRRRPGARAFDCTLGGRGGGGGGDDARSRRPPRVRADEDGASAAAAATRWGGPKVLLVLQRHVPRRRRRRAGCASRAAPRERRAARRAGAGARAALGGLRRRRRVLPRRPARAPRAADARACVISSPRPTTACTATRSTAARASVRAGRAARIPGRRARAARRRARRAARARRARCRRRVFQNVGFAVVLWQLEVPSYTLYGVRARVGQLLDPPTTAAPRRQRRAAADRAAARCSPRAAARRRAARSCGTARGGDLARSSAAARARAGRAQRGALEDRSALNHFEIDARPQRRRARPRAATRPPRRPSPTGWRTGVPGGGGRPCICAQRGRRRARRHGAVRALHPRRLRDRVRRGGARRARAARAAAARRPLGVAPAAAAAAPTARAPTTASSSRTRSRRTRARSSGRRAARRARGGRRRRAVLAEPRYARSLAATRRGLPATATGASARAVLGARAPRSPPSSRRGARGWNPAAPARPRLMEFGVDVQPAGCVASSLE